MRDLVALGAYNISFTLIVPFTDRIPIPNYVPAGVAALPVAYKLVLFMVVEDFGLYWVHRVMHTKLFWSTHKWHHYPTYMYWLAGARTSIPHIILFNFTFVAARPLLVDAPGWLFQLISIEHIIRNNWMHMNVSWESTRIESVIVTPRYHHIHHSSEPAHAGSNLGSLLTIWDRLFGTYLNPSKVNHPLEFGIGQRLNPVRLILGI